MKTYRVEVSDNGTESWYLNDKRHREDGPAVKYANGTNCWYMNGKLHREDGPAIEYSNGTKTWYVNGKCHREDGPASVCLSGSKYWYLHDVQYTEAEFNAKMSPTVELTVADIETLLGHRVKIVK